MIKEITFEDCLSLWSALWPDRVSPIEATSAMMLVTQEELDNGIERLYTNATGEPTFLGFYEGNELVGVNSFHRVDNTIRSRGLFVASSRRGKGIASQLLGETLRRAGDDVLVWSYPRDTALIVYVKAGFTVTSHSIQDPIEGRNNYYVQRSAT